MNSKIPGDVAHKTDRRISVLLVDDDLDLNRVLSRGLEHEGFKVVSALTAAESLSFVADPEVQIEVLVIDLHLPDSWGAFAAMENRMIRPHLPVVYISGESQDEIVLASATSGSGVLFLAKPFAATELATEIRRALAEATV
jgi:DNA-binding NtrC family response regulator